MRIHFIAIGGAAMHNLALALSGKSYEITGSDDEIFEPSLSRLKKQGLLPKTMGWFPEKIDQTIDLVILGMHARKDNPELLKAQELGIPINSYPEFIYRACKTKKRVVIAGSHGKTTTTSMILHVLKKLGRDFDYMVGAQIRGFENMVKLSDAPLVILEGDEYFSSPIDMKAKFLWYRPHLATITGIAWDHINVYPTKESYEKSFEEFIDSMEDHGKLYYYEGDHTLKILAKFGSENVLKIPYDTIEHTIEGQTTFLENKGKKVAIGIFGNHNLQNLQAAKFICGDLGIDESTFIHAIADFEGAANRLELILENEKFKIFKDFAHSPSKLKATVEACKNQFSSKNLLAVMELHTFSSLDTQFLKEYKDTMKDADTGIVFYSPETIAHKRLKSISPEDIKEAFGQDELLVLTDPIALKQAILEQCKTHEVILLMSSGKFNGIDLDSLSQEITHSV